MSDIISEIVATCKAIDEERNKQFEPHDSGVNSTTEQITTYPDDTGEKDGDT